MRSILAFALMAIMSCSQAHADIGQVLGLKYDEDPIGVDRAFERAGIERYTFEDIEIVEAEWNAYLEKKAKKLLTENVQRSAIFHRFNMSMLPSIECKSYENAIVKRDDLELVTVCFMMETQVFIVPVFKEDRRDMASLTKIVSQEYGRPSKKVRDFVFWSNRPWYQAGLYPRRWIFLVDNIRSHPGPMLYYFDCWQLLEIRNRIEKIHRDTGVTRQTEETKGL